MNYLIIVHSNLTLYKISLLAIHYNTEMYAFRYSRTFEVDGRDCVPIFAFGEWRLNCQKDLTSISHNIGHEYDRVLFL